jgi:hypothetical protein
MIERGISLRELEQFWRSLGGTVERVRRTGESRLIHPSGARSTLYGCRRKDAPVKLVSFVNRFQKGLVSSQRAIRLSSSATDTTLRKRRG